jgi:iron complex outermembrane recepter protein
MRGAGGCGRGASRLATARRRLLQATAVGALTLPGALMFPNVASGQIAVTLPEVTVTAPRRPPAQRAARAVAPPGAAQSARVSAPAPSPPPTPASAPQIPAFQVVATTPVTGLGVYSPNVTQTLDQRIPGVFISDVQGNEFTSDLRYRGFTASPLQGTPQGLAVYMQGIRVNEAFGDTVNWDLIPTIAIGRADVWTNNPAFGLNALGGAISFQMKDGFTYRGTEFDASGGSYGRVCGSLQYGIRNGEWALYFAAQGSRTMAGATSRRRASPASMAISAGKAPMRRSTWSRAPPTITSA